MRCQIKEIVKMSDLYFNEESDYSEENTSDNEDFPSTILQSVQFEPEQKKTCAAVELLVQMRTLQKRSKRNRLSLLQKGGRNVYCCSKNPEERWKHLAIQLLCELPDYYSHVLALSTQ